ncbi:MAG: rhodanese-like domain-containing protein [Pseudomonadota bacterium]
MEVRKRLTSGLRARFRPWPVVPFLLGFLSAAASGQSMISVTEAARLVAADDNVIILDVRSSAEFAASHLSGAANLSVEDERFDDAAARLDPDKTYIVHCTANPEEGRSSRALEKMERLGFSRLYSLEGGYVAWKEAELPLTEVDQ